MVDSEPATPPARATAAVVAADGPTRPIREPLFDPVTRADELDDRPTLRAIEAGSDGSQDPSGWTAAPGDPVPARIEAAATPRIAIEDATAAAPQAPRSGVLGAAGPPPPPPRTFPPVTASAATPSFTAHEGSPGAPTAESAHATGEISAEFAWADGPETATDTAAGPPIAPGEPPGPELPAGWITAPPAAPPAAVSRASHRRHPAWIAAGVLGTAVVGVAAWQLYSQLLAPRDEGPVVSARDTTHVQMPASGVASPADPARAASPMEAGRAAAPHPAIEAVTGRGGQTASPGAPRPPGADPAPSPATGAVAASGAPRGTVAAPPSNPSALASRDGQAATTATATARATGSAAAPPAGRRDLSNAPGSAAAPPRAITPPPTTLAESLAIASTPPGARVFLDGADAGVTPLKLPGSPDRHNVALVLAGHELYVAQVDGHGTFQVPLKEVTPTNGPAGIKLLRCKDKERYYVFVDGKPTGQTCPTERIGCEVGPHTVEVYDAVSETRRRWDIVVKDTRLSFRIRIDP